MNKLVEIESYRAAGELLLALVDLSGSRQWELRPGPTSGSVQFIWRPFSQRRSYAVDFFITLPVMSDFPNLDVMAREVFGVMKARFEKAVDGEDHTLQHGAARDGQVLQASLEGARKLRAEDQRREAKGENSV